METVRKEESAPPECPQAGSGHGDGRMRGAGMGQRVLEEPGKGGTGKEGFWLHNQLGGPGRVLRGSCFRKKVPKSALGGTSPPVVHFQDVTTECRKIPAPKPQVRDARPWVPVVSPARGLPRGAPRVQGTPGIQGQAIPCSGGSCSFLSPPSNLPPPLGSAPRVPASPGRHTRPCWDLMEPPNLDAIKAITPGQESRL